jgi:hypothetical protein
LFAAFFLFAGCLSNQAFVAEQIKNPCSVVTVEEMKDICGYSYLESEEHYTDFRGDFFGMPVGPQVTSTCEYRTSNNRSTTVTIVSYFPESDLTYSEYKNELERFNDEMNSNLIIEEENLEIGDNSFLLRSIDRINNETSSISIQVFKGSSVISVVIPNINETNKCFSRENTKKIAQLALDNLTKVG